MTHLSAMNDKLGLIAITGPLAFFRPRISSVRLVVLFLFFVGVLLTGLVGLLFHRFLHICEVTGMLNKPTSLFDRSKNKKEFYCSVESMA